MFESGQKIFIEAEYRSGIPKGVADDAQSIGRFAKAGAESLREVVRASKEVEQGLQRAEASAKATGTAAQGAFGRGSGGTALTRGGIGGGGDGTAALAASFAATRAQIAALEARGPAAQKAMEGTAKGANAVAGAIGGLARQAGLLAVGYGAYQLGKGVRDHIADLHDQAAQLSIMEATMSRLGSSPGNIKGVQGAISGMSRDADDLRELTAIYQGLLDVTGSWKNSLIGTPLVQDIAAGSSLSLAEAQKAVTDALTGSLEPSAAWGDNVNKLIKDGAPAVEILQAMAKEFGGLRVEMEKLTLGEAFKRWWSFTLTQKGHPLSIGSMAGGVVAAENWLIDKLTGATPQPNGGVGGGIMSQRGLRPGTTAVTDWLFTGGYDPFVPLNPKKAPKAPPFRPDGPVPGYNQEWYQPSWDSRNPSIRGYGGSQYAMGPFRSVGESMRNTLPQDMPFQGLEDWADEWDKILAKRKEFEEGLRRQSDEMRSIGQSLQGGLENAFAAALTSGKGFVDALRDYMLQQLIVAGAGAFVNAIPGLAGTGNTGLLGALFGGGGGTTQSVSPSSAINRPLGPRGAANAKARSLAYRGIN